MTTNMKSNEDKIIEYLSGLPGKRASIAKLRDDFQDDHKYVDMLVALDELIHSGRIRELETYPAQYQLVEAQPTESPAEPPRQTGFFMSSGERAVWIATYAAAWVANQPAFPGYPENLARAAAQKASIAVDGLRLIANKEDRLRSSDAAYAIIVEEP